jgi:hypothetical protein
MGVTFSSNFGDIGKNLRKAVSAKAEEGVAQKLAQLARSKGLTSADQVELNITGNDDGGLDIDEARVRARANEIINDDPRSIADESAFDDDTD